MSPKSKNRSDIRQFGGVGAVLCVDSNTIFSERGLSLQPLPLWRVFGAR